MPTHRVSWFQRLLGIQDLPRHSLAAEFDADLEEAGSQSDAAAIKAQQDWWRGLFNLTAERTGRYNLYREMDSFDLLSSILDLYAEEASQPDYDTKRVVWVESNNVQIKAAAMDCLTRLRVDDSAFPIIRDMCKFGDRFQRLLYQGGQGVLSWTPIIKPETVTRIEDRLRRLIGFTEENKKYRGALKREVSWPWDYVHFRLLGRDDATGYGTSILQNLYRPARQLLLSEDAALMTRLRRGVDRNLFLVDVGDLDETEAAAWVNRWRKAMRKHEYLDPLSPRYVKSYNPLNPLEDMFVPFRGSDDASRVETLASTGQGIDEIFDLDYFRKKLFGSARVLPAALGFEGDLNGKSTLAQQDVRFARTAKKVQRYFIQGVRTMIDTNLVLLSDETEKYNPFVVNNGYVVQMAPISYLDELDRLELIKLRHEIVQSVGTLASDMNLDPKVWAMHLLLTFAKLPEELVLKLVAKTTIPEPAAALAAEALAKRVGPERAQQILDVAGDSKKGFYSISEAEQLEMAKLVHTHPGIRKLLGGFAETALDDAWRIQGDPSVTAFRDLEATAPLFDSEDKNVKQLLEDYRGLVVRPVKNTTLNEA